MKSIGIIANPASGKDIRRLVSHATVVDNHEKINIVERIVLAAQKFGVKKVYIMPDTYQIGYKVEDNLKTSKELIAEIEVVKIRLSGSSLDSTEAARHMKTLNVGCIIALGGDGTCRAVAKEIDDIPFIGLSTGTNNVYPKMIEGTVVGIAAAIMASSLKGIKDYACHRDKRIEIYKNNAMLDIALVDAVITKNIFAGAKAIWDFEDLMRVYVTKANPASIGFSAIIGTMSHITESDDFGGVVDINNGGERYLVPIAAGIISEIEGNYLEKIVLNEYVPFEPNFNGMIALDGEREIRFEKGDRFEIKLTRLGPLHVDVQKALLYAQEQGFFRERLD